MNVQQCHTDLLHFEVVNDGNNQAQQGEGQSHDGDHHQGFCILIVVSVGLKHIWSELQKKVTTVL